MRAETETERRERDEIESSEKERASKRASERGREKNGRERLFIRIRDWGRGVEKGSRREAMRQWHGQ